MTGFLQSVNGLGNQVATHLRRANGDLRRLSHIAESALADFSDVDGLELEELADFLERTNLRQQVTNPFSDLPVTVFQARDFYIEVLVWSHATTAIHQHGFAGAFRVVRGSSIHTRYHFQQEQRVSDDLLIGKVAAVSSESLSLGSVRRIDPGMDGLVHSLYHLDNPSISLIIRDRGHSAFGPQYSYYPPALAIHRRALESDELVSMFSRLLEVASRLDRSEFLAIWSRRIAHFEFPRLAWLYLRYHNELEQEERAAVRRSAEAVHGDMVQFLFDSVERYAEQHQLVRMRERVHDPELRFFLALLMNVPDRSDLLRMVNERFPERDPVACCAQWLTRLSVDEMATVDRMKEVARMIESSGPGAMQFSRRLRKALPGGVTLENASVIFSRFVRGSLSSADCNDASQNGLDMDRAMMELAALPQLSVFDKRKYRSD